MNRDAQLTALLSRAITYDEAAMRAHDATTIKGFLDAAAELREHADKLAADVDHELPKKVRQELGFR